MRRLLPFLFFLWVAGLLVGMTTPRVVIIPVMLPEGMHVVSTDFHISAYLAERPLDKCNEEIYPTYLKLTEVPKNSNRYFALINMACFVEGWSSSETYHLVIDVMHKQLPISGHTEIFIPNGTSSVRPETGFTVGYATPYLCSYPLPDNHANDIAVELAKLGWSYQSTQGYADPVGFRVLMSRDSTFKECAYQFVEGEAGDYLMNIPPRMLPLVPGVTYYWKVVPTTSTNKLVQSDTQRMVKVNGRIVMIRATGDAENIPIWSFTIRK